MVKLHSKLIYILITLFVIATVLLLSSCGQSNPVGASSTNPAKTTTNSNAFTSFPSGKAPTPLPAWMNGLSPASISCLLKQPNLNLNATSPNKKPFNEVCGSYKVAYAYQYHQPLHYIDSRGLFHMWYDLWKTVSLNGNIINSSIVGEYKGDNLTINMLPASYAYTIPCDDPCLMGGNFPQDAFTGNGAGQGPFVDGNGNLYGPDTPSDPAKPRKLVAVGISPDTASVSVGGTTSFTGTAYYVNGSAPYTSDITDQIISGNSAVAMIANGLVTGVSQGQAVLRVTLGGYSAVSVVNVGLGTLASVSVEPSPVQLSKGETKQLKAIAHYPNSVNVDITSNPNTTWTLGNVGSTRAASVNSTGTVTGLASGTAIVQASYQGKKSPVVNVTVLDKKLQSISVSPASATIYIYPTKGTKQYTASGSYSDGSSKPVAVDWTSSDTNIATIDANGLATAATQPGTTYITAASTADGSMITSGLPDAELNVRCFNYAVHYRQNQSPWMTSVYNNYASTGAMLNSGMLDHSIGAVGCYITSVANAMNAAGTDVTPQQLNDWMVAPNDGFLSNHTANDDRAFDYPGSHIQAITAWQDTNITDIKNQLSQCNIILAKVYGTTAFTNGHYVLIVKEDIDGRLMMLDPWKYSSDSAGVYYEYVDKRYTINQYKVLSVK